MGRSYAGILGSLAFVVVLIRGIIGGEAETTLRLALLCMFAFAGVGFVVGRIAERTVADSVRHRLKAELSRKKNEEATREEGAA